jgi:hypothetical protein
MRVWMHKETGKIMITWQCYGMWSEVRDGIKLQSPIYVGEACENENGIICIFSNSIYKYFELIGEL